MAPAKAVSVDAMSAQVFLAVARDEVKELQNVLRRNSVRRRDHRTTKLGYRDLVRAMDIEPGWHEPIGTLRLFDLFENFRCGSGHELRFRERGLAEDLFLE